MACLISGIEKLLNNQQFTQWCKQQSVPSITKQEMPLIMGIINVTPDSFSDAGRFLQLGAALELARTMIAAGADLLDIGGESSRPFASPITQEEEIARVVPLIEHIRLESDICISIDTTKPAVMRAAVSAGANVINDITALGSDESLETAFQLQVPVCLMHMQGTPGTMQDHPQYTGSVVEEINDFFDKTIQRCLSYGIPGHHLILDPGFGFGKSVQHNLQIIKYFERFKCHNLPVMLGVSRKSTLGVVLNKPLNERLIAGVSLTSIAALYGAAMIRTHDVDETKQALQMTYAVMQAANEVHKEDRINGSM